MVCPQYQIPGTVLAGGYPNLLFPSLRLPARAREGKSRKGRCTRRVTEEKGGLARRTCNHSLGTQFQQSRSETRSYCPRSPCFPGRRLPVLAQHCWARCAESTLWSSSTFHPYMYPKSLIGPQNGQTEGHSPSGTLTHTHPTRHDPYSINDTYLVLASYNSRRHQAPGLYSGQGKEWYYSSRKRSASNTVHCDIFGRHLRWSTSRAIVTHNGWIYIVMQRVHGECLAYSWKSRSAESQTRILQQLKCK